MDSAIYDGIVKLIVDNLLQARDHSRSPADRRHSLKLVFQLRRVLREAHPHLKRSRRAARPRLRLAPVPVRRVRAPRRRRSTPPVAVRVATRDGPAGESAPAEGDPRGPLKAGISPGFCIALAWLKQASRNEYDAQCEALWIGTALGGITILTSQDMAKMDRFESELRGDAWRQLKEIASGITDDQRRELCALLWYGRDDGDLQYCRQHAVVTDPRVAYIFANPLDIYLVAALQRLGLLIDGGEA